MEKRFNTQPYKGSPFIWGSEQSTLGMDFVYQGAPYQVVNGPPGADYVYDSLGRLTTINFTNGNTVTYSYDAAGNRTSVVTVA